MKYIKLYEKYLDDFINDDETDIIKKYIIWKYLETVSETEYEILMLTEITEKEIENKYWTRILYKVIDNEIELVYNHRTQWFKMSDSAENILYSSNNLQGCLNKMKIFLDIDKYNL